MMTDMLNRRQFLTGVAAAAAVSPVNPAPAFSWDLAGPGSERAVVVAATAADEPALAAIRNAFDKMVNDWLMDELMYGVHIAERTPHGVRRIDPATVVMSREPPSHWIVTGSARHAR